MQAVSKQQVDERVKKVLEDGSWHNCFRLVKWTYRDEVLTLGGKVPSFYLRQLLQKQLQSVAEVREINNRVDVVTSEGLSSV